MYLVLALIMFLLSKLASSFRLNRFLHVAEIKLSEIVNAKLYLLGMYYNLFLPGGIGGDGYKVYLLVKEFRVRTRRIVTAIFLDRVSGLFALFCLLVLLSFFITFKVKHLYLLWTLIPVATMLFYAVHKLYFPEYLTALKRTSLLSFGVQSFQLFSAYFILCALGNTSGHFSYLFVFLISSVVALVPFTIGGIGARELTFFVGAQWLALDIHISLAASFLFFAITAFVSSWGIIYSFRKLELTK